MPERQHVQFERMVQAPLARSADCTVAQLPAAQLGLQREEAAELDAAISANLPVRRSRCEGGKELGYGS